MRKVILYIAMSLDGYIADENGGVSWLSGQDPDGELPGELELRLMETRSYNGIVELRYEKR